MASKPVPPDQIKTPSIQIGIQEGRGGSVLPPPRLKFERALFRRSMARHLAAEQELERLLAGFMAAAVHKPHCKCGAAKALRALADELDAVSHR